MSCGIWSTKSRTKRRQARTRESVVSGRELRQGSSMTKTLYGLMAEFETPEQVLQAAERALDEGYRRMDAYTPFPVEGLAEAVGFYNTRLSAIVLAGGLTGACTGFFLCWWPNVIGYTLKIGGKPYNTWPAFIPITFELTILFSE